MGAFQKDMLYSEWKSTVSTRQWVVIAMCVVRRWCVLESVNCSWSPAQCFWRFCSVVCCRYTTTLTPSCRPSSTVSTTRTPVSQWVCVLRKRLNCSVSRQSSTVFLQILQRGLLLLHNYTDRPSSTVSTTRTPVYTFSPATTTVVPQNPIFFHKAFPP